MKPSLTLLILLVVLFSQNLAAFPNELTVSVRVTVADPNDAVIPQCLLVFKSKKFKARGYSNEAGSFMIELPSGEYEVEIERDGFKTFKKLEVITGTRKELKFQLDPMPGIILYCPDPYQQIEIKTSLLTDTIKPRKIQ